MQKYLSPYAEHTYPAALLAAAFHQKLKLLLAQGLSPVLRLWWPFLEQKQKKDHQQKRLRNSGWLARLLTDGSRLCEHNLIFEVIL